MICHLPEASIAASEVIRLAATDYGVNCRKFDNIVAQATKLSYHLDMATTDALSPKYQQVYTALRREIQSGRLKKGDRLPSEAELVRTFGASRITVGRAVRDLQAAGLVERRAGSGTYVQDAADVRRALSFGLLIPDLGETEIFEPICQGMMASPLAREHALIWGSPGGELERGARLAAVPAVHRSWRLRRVLRAARARPAARTKSTSASPGRSTRRGFPSCCSIVPSRPTRGRGHHDLVGIDNRRAGYVDHRAPAAARSPRVAFVGDADTRRRRSMRAKPAIVKRCTRGGVPIERSTSCIASIRRTTPAVARSWRRHAPDAIVCANDRTAARLMHDAPRLGYRVPATSEWSASTTWSTPSCCRCR